VGKAKKVGGRRGFGRRKGVVIRKW